jgi:hypothetical protein
MFIPARTMIAAWTEFRREGKRAQPRRARGAQNEVFR